MPIDVLAFFRCFLAFLLTEDVVWAWRPLELLSLATVVDYLASMLTRGLYITLFCYDNVPCYFTLEFETLRSTLDFLSSGLT